MFLHGSVLSRDFKRFAQLPVLVLVHVAVHMLVIDGGADGDSDGDADLFSL